MKKFEENIKNVAHNVVLSEQEKERMRERLHEYMNFVPIRSSQANVRRTWLLNYTSIRVSAALAMLAVVFTSGIGVTYASNDALPGEKLYVVKEVREDVVAALTFNATARAEWEVERTHRRLEEVETLATRGALDEETEVLVTQKYEEQLAQAEKSIEQLEGKDPAQAQALRVALVVGSEARVEALEKPYDVERGARDDIRARVALLVRERLTVESGDSASGTVATLALTQRLNTRESILTSEVSPKAQALHTEVQEEGTPSIMSITATTSSNKAAGVAQHTQSAVVAELVRVLNQQKAQLKEKTRTHTNNEQKEELQEVLARISDMQELIATDVRLGAYEQAHARIKSALHTLHTARAAIEADISVRSAFGGGREEKTEEHKTELIEEIKDILPREIRPEVKFDVESQTPPFDRL